MTDRIDDIDHLMVSVRDSAVAGETFERLGFYATPRSILPGMSNRLVCFPSPYEGRCNFIELMALDDAAAAPDIMQSILRPEEGPVSMVMTVEDVPAVDARLRRLGVGIAATMDFQRDWTLPSGEVVSPAFGVIIPEFGQFPMYWNVCQHKTPELYQSDLFVSHPNGAQRLTSILGYAPSPADVAAAYTAAWGSRVERDGAGVVHVVTGDVDLLLYDDKGLAQAFPDFPSPSAPALLGATIKVADPDAQADRMRAAGFQVLACAAGCYPEPASTHGCLTVFTG